MLIIRSDPRLPPPAHVLAGVDNLLTKCHDFCRRMFALYDAGAVAGRMSAFFWSKSCFRVDITVSGLLVTGRAGAGKTSVVQATSKALQWDPQIHACKQKFMHQAGHLIVFCSHALCRHFSLYRKTHPDLAHAISILARQGDVASTKCSYI